MPRNPIPALRLAAQQLLSPTLDEPTEVVRHLGAVQAQDFPMALWAVGARLRSGTIASLTDALDRGSILRTHVLRPTWHLVAAEDIRWMLRLSAPQVRSIFASSGRQLGLEAAQYRKAHRLFEKHLQGGKQATRAELVALLQQHRIPTEANGAAHVLIDAELEGVLCSGAGAGRLGTYALLEERVPRASNDPDREEAAARLAQRYFQSHGPATFDDFAWWSGLPRSLARNGTEAARSGLAALTWDNATYLMAPHLEPARALPSFLLPAFDEYLIAYRDRSAVINPIDQAKAFTSNGIFRPVVVENGTARATWKRVTGKGGAQSLQVHAFDPAAPPAPQKLAKALRRYAAFMEAPVVLADANP